MFNYQKSKRKEYDWEITLPEDLNLLTEYYEYDESLSEIENIVRKFRLKQHGQILQLEEMYEEAIDFYKELIENSYFKNDWYPYRQLTIMYEKTDNHEANLENIKKFFYSGIYCNKYQLVWFKHKLKRISANQNDIETLISYYNQNGANNKNKMHKPVIHADCMTTRKNILKTFTLEHFDFKQRKYELRELCRMLEFENDYEKELEVLKKYYNELPKGGMRKNWYNDKLAKINDNLNTHYTIEYL